MIRLLAMLALLNTGQSIAGIYSATNQMPEVIHDLMDTEGAGKYHMGISLRAQNTNSLRHLQPAPYTHFIPLEMPTNKVSWSFWNNSTIKRVDRNAGAPNGSNPTSLSQYEFDINYSFSF